MADTASLIARVKTEGADVAAKQLDAMAASADRADTSVNKLTPDVNKVNTATSKAASDGSLSSVTLPGRLVSRCRTW